MARRSSKMAAKFNDKKGNKRAARQGLTCDVSKSDAAAQTDHGTSIPHGCYNRDGRHTVECVHGYDACWAWDCLCGKRRVSYTPWYAPFRFDFHAGSTCIVKRRTTTSGAGRAWPRAYWTIVMWPQRGAGGGRRRRRLQEEEEVEQRQLALGLGLGLGLGGLLLIGLDRRAMSLEEEAVVDVDARAPTSRTRWSRRARPCHERTTRVRLRTALLWCNNRRTYTSYSIAGAARPRAPARPPCARRRGACAARRDPGRRSRARRGARPSRSRSRRSGPSCGRTSSGAVRQLNRRTRPHRSRARRRRGPSPPSPAASPMEKGRGDAREDQGLTADVLPHRAQGRQRVLPDFNAVQFVRWAARSRPRRRSRTCRRRRPWCSWWRRW